MCICELSVTICDTNTKIEHLVLATTYFCPKTIIGSARLNFSVRNGKRCDPCDKSPTLNVRFYMCTQFKNYFKLDEATSRPVLVSSRELSSGSPTLNVRFSDCFSSSFKHSSIKGTLCSPFFTIQLHIRDHDRTQTCDLHIF